MYIIVYIYIYLSIYIYIISLQTYYLFAQLLQLRSVQIQTLLQHPDC